MAIKNQEVTDEYAIYNGDCVDLMKTLPPGKIGLCIFSPPFANLYSYSDSPRDMGNCKTYDEFFTHFDYVIAGIKKIMMPGRIVAVHCIDIPAMKERDGYIGLKDFPGDLVKAFQKQGFVYHSKHVIWKDPLIEAVRTKAIGLAHKQLCKDSSKCRAGLPDYLIAFRQEGENKIPIKHGKGMTAYCGSSDPGGEGVKRGHNIWRRYASPVWMDIRQTRTLNYRAAREPEDEKHLCPLQLDVIERACVLWSNPGEVVFTPFMGVGSECYGAVINDRKAVGVELKTSYYNQAVKNMKDAVRSRVEQGDLFSGEEI
jgi:DNA modification methylase